MGEKRVVITGMGTVNPLGNSVTETWDKASAGISGIARITRFDASRINAKIAGEVKDYDMTPFVSEKHLKIARRMDPFVHYAAGAVSEALSQSGLDVQIETDRLGICIGSGLGGVDAQNNASAALATTGPRRISPFYIPAAIGNIATGLLSIIYDITGPNLSVQTACATSNHSMIIAFMTIKSGLADAMIAGGTEGAVTELGTGGFSNRRALSTNFNDDPIRASRPYDVDRDGFVIAEGAGALIFEEFDHARERGADILCEVKSIGMSGDAYDLVMPEPNGEGAERSMRMALNTGEIPIEELHYVNTHGTSTPLGDVAEAKAVYRVLDGNEEFAHVSSTKSVHGHVLGATGAVEAIICVEAIRHGIVPPSINIDRLDPEVPLSCINTVPIEKDIRVALSNSFGFGGHNSSVVLAKI